MLPGNRVIYLQYPAAAANRLCLDRIDLDGIQPRTAGSGNIIRTDSNVLGEVVILMMAISSFSFFFLFSTLKI